jgi:dTDP-4-amino-4,6-dideoxygalactose transaminase
VRRRQLFRSYAAAFEGTPVKLPFTRGRHADELDGTGVHILPTLLPAGSDRAAVVEQLGKAGIQTSVHYPPIHGFSAYRADGARLERTTALCERELSLPFYPDLSDADVDRVAGELLSILDAQG